MSSFSRWVPVIGGAVAGGAIALVIASGTSSTHSVTTTTVVRPSQAALPASFSSGGGETVNQIYRSASPGVVDIIVTSQSQSPSFGFFGGGGSGNQTTQGEGAGVVYNRSGDILTDEHVVSGRDLGPRQLPERQELFRQGRRHRPVDRRRGDPCQRARLGAASDPVRELV